MAGLLFLATVKVLAYDRVSPDSENCHLPDQHADARRFFSRVQPKHPAECSATPQDES